MGIVYVIVGFTALIAAFDRRLQPTGAEGALYALRASALGRAALATFVALPWRRRTRHGGGESTRRSRRAA